MSPVKSMRNMRIMSVNSNSLSAKKRARLKSEFDGLKEKMSCLRKEKRSLSAMSERQASLSERDLVSHDLDHHQSLTNDEKQIEGAISTGQAASKIKSLKRMCYHSEEKIC